MCGTPHSQELTTQVLEWTMRGAGGTWSSIGRGAAIYMGNPIASPSAERTRGQTQLAICYILSSHCLPHTGQCHRFCLLGPLHPFLCQTVWSRILPVVFASALHSSPLCADPASQLLSTNIAVLLRGYFSRSSFRPASSRAACWFNLLPACSLGCIVGKSG